MKIERLTKEKKELVKDIYRLCFAAPFDSDSFNTYLDSDDLWEYVWGINEDEVLLSSYVAYEGQVKIRSIPFNVYYFDGFVTRPGFRNKGMGRKLFENQRKIAKKRGIKLFALDPFKNSYYKQFGFEDALDLLKIEIPMRNLSKEKIDELYTTQTISAFQSKMAMTVLREIYEREWNDSNYNPMLLPDAYFMGMFHKKSWKLCYLNNEDQQHIGSLLYEIEDRTMTVYKISFFDLKALLTFRDFFSQFRDQIDKISFFKVPPDFPVDIFAETFHAGSSHVNMCIYPTRMMQILDVENVIKQLCPVLELPEDPIHIQFTDQQIQENNKVLSFSKKGVKRLKSKKGDLAMKVSDFVPVFTGRYSFTDQFKKGRVKMENQPNPLWNSRFHPSVIQELDIVFQKTLTHNNEFCF